MAHYNFHCEKLVWDLMFAYLDNIQGKLSTIKLLVLTKASNIEVMWATINSNLGEVTSANHRNNVR